MNHVEMTIVKLYTAETFINLAPIMGAHWAQVAALGELIHATYELCQIQNPKERLAALKLMFELKARAEAITEDENIPV